MGLKGFRKLKSADLLSMIVFFLKWYSRICWDDETAMHEIEENITQEKTVHTISLMLIIGRPSFLLWMVKLAWLGGEMRKCLYNWPNVFDMMYLMVMIWSFTCSFVGDPFSCNLVRWLDSFDRWLFWWICWMFILCTTHRSPKKFHLSFLNPFPFFSSIHRCLIHPFFFFTSKLIFWSVAFTSIRQYVYRIETRKWSP